MTTPDKFNAEQMELTVDNYLQLPIISQYLTSQFNKKVTKLKEKIEFLRHGNLLTTLDNKLSIYETRDTENNTQPEIMEDIHNIKTVQAFIMLGEYEKAYAFIKHLDTFPRDLFSDDILPLLQFKLMQATYPNMSTNELLTEYLNNVSILGKEPT